MRWALLLTAILVLGVLPLATPEAAASPPGPKVVVGPLLTPPNPAVYATFPFSLQPTGQPPALAPAGPQEDVVVIMVDFSDRGPAPAHTPTYYTGLMFDTSPGASSVHNFYLENSYNQTTLGGVVADGWYRSSRTMVYYGEDAGGVDDANGPIYCLTVEAVLLANADVDFSSFDRNADGVVDHVVVIHAGGGQENSADTNLIWSHRWAIIDARNCRPGDRRLQVDGVEIYGYYMAAESSPMGVFAHELGHDFGLPDLYDTSGNTLGIGLWGVMGTGSWNGNPAGSAPAHFTAWTKAQLGWLTLIEVTQPLLPATLRQVETFPDAYKLPIQVSGFGEEYFVVENRQRVGFDAGLPAGGVLIWHVDETRDNNNVPTARLLDLEEADDGNGVFFADKPDQPTDVWADNAVGFHANSTPDSNDNSGVKTGWKVVDIGPSGTTMTADISKGVALDIAVLSIAKEDFVPVNQTLSVEVTVRNKGLAEVPNASLSLSVYREVYDPSARVFTDDTVLPPLAEGATAMRGYTLLSAVPGRYLVEARVELLGDEVPEDNVRIVHYIAGDLLLQDDVEGGIAGWDRPTNPGSLHLWEVVEDDTGYGAAHSPTRAWRFGYFDLAGPTVAYTYHYLESPLIALDGATPRLVFYQRYQLLGRTETNQTLESDVATVEARFDGGPWIAVASYSGAQPAWKRVYVDLAPYADNASTLQFRFNATANVIPDNGGWWIDDLWVVTQPLGPGALVIPLVTQGEVLPGGAVAYQFVLVNVGDVFEEFHFEVTGLPPDWSALIGANETAASPVTDYRVELDVDEQLALNLIVQAPLLAQPGATLDGVLVALTSGEAANASFIFSVAVPLGFGFDLSGQTLVLVVIVAGLLLAIAVVLTAVKRRRGY